MSLTLKEWRRARGLSVATMSRLLDIHYNTYTRWEENPSRIPVGNAVKCAEVLNVPFDDIDFLSSVSTEM